MPLPRKKRSSLSSVFVRLVALMLLIPVPGFAAEQPLIDAPFGVAINSKDVIFVAELGAKRIAKFSLDGQPLGEIKEVEGYGPLMGPFAVAIGPNDRIAIADTRNHRILVLDANEKLLFAIGEGKKRGNALGDFAEPHFLTFNDKGELFVSDTFNARIQKFAPDGKFIKTWGKVGSGPGEYVHNGYLANISVDNKGYVYVREFDGGKIQKYTEDGEYVATFSRRGGGDGELDEGYGLAVIDDLLYCPDTFESRMVIFTLDGKLKDTWAPGEGNSGSHFNNPVGIAEASTGELIVTDWKNNRLLKLDKTGKFLATWGRPMVEEILKWKPPQIVKRAPRDPVRFSVYAGIDDVTIKEAKEAGVGVIYPSMEYQYRDWNIDQTVAKAMSQGVKIHPSVACLPFGQGITNSDVYEKHPDWCLWKKDATEPMKTILGWSNPEARSFRADHIVAQVKASGVTGIMLDYIRYLGTDYGYDPAAVDGFFKKYGVDPLTLPQDDQRWMQYRADFVTQFIVELRRKLATEIPDRYIEISVYLAGDDPAPDLYLKHAMQDWKTWARMGIIDELIVAWYTRDIDQIYTAVRRVREAAPDRVKINSFIACYGGNLNTPELLAKGIEASIAGGADEVTIYRGDSISELDMWPAIKAGVSAQRAAEAHPKKEPVQ